MKREPKKIDKVPIVLSDGKERELYYTFEAAEMIERANEQNLPKTRQMIVMLHAGLIHADPELTVNDVAKLCEMANAEYYDACIGDALLRQQANPTQPATTPAKVNGAVQTVPTGTS